ncbi:ThiF family adenylyltransferase [Sedimentibacter hydroxybenzoicus DSM 7310]|uniref:ThiF family adenylyltransferase n=1 Tax=Sedimentibacter hydroxybenzoicus DSM 7310 TaxID=1123245 RepID=A0A974GUY5_SEDHY|nr:ThiF family adenylyltransferase [Sedimentibacter hydroxybenzoicus]NYB72818.1 ThiF family adenylyltransferase [Sedimentibacter hydroxybenzoicus DSM 7310]
MIDRKLLEFEKQVMKDKYPDFKFYQGRVGKLQNIWWSGKIKVINITYNVGICLSDTYPNSRPYVYILDDSLNIDDLDTPHKNKRSLCLYTSDGSENSWHKEYRLVDVIERLKDFLYLHQKGKHKDVHKTIIDPLIDLTDTTKYVLDFSWFPDNGMKSGYIEFESISFNSNFNYAVKVMNFNMEEIDSIENVYMKCSGYCIKKEVIKWIYLNGERIETILHLKRKIDLNKFVFKKESVKGYYDLEMTKCIIFTGRDKKGIVINIDERLSFSNVIEINKNQFFARNKGLIDVDKLASKTVSIFGVGSLGSKMVEMLARSGVSSFILFDYDQFTPENLSRNILTIEDLFLNKADAIKHRIKKINPWAKVNSVSLSQNILYYDELYGYVLSLLEQSDLIICSTGDAESEYDINFIINDLSKHKIVPTIFTAILGNGFGGRMHRVEIGKTPCYQCIKILQESDPELYKLFTQEMYMENDQNKYGIYSEAGIPGLDVDINMVAAITAKMCLEILLNKSNPVFKFNSYIWGNQTGWEFSEPFQLKDIRFDRVNNCPICGEDK